MVDEEQPLVDTSKNIRLTGTLYKSHHVETLSESVFRAVIRDTHIAVEPRISPWCIYQTLFETQAVRLECRCCALEALF